MRDATLKKIPVPFWVLLAVAFLIAAGACRGRDSQPSGEEVRVSSSTAYEKHFGSPPTAEKGRCYALVGYLPTRDEPARVRPFPLFLFTDQNQISLLVERLLEENGSNLDRLGLTNPFPRGTFLKGLHRDGGAVTLHLGNAGDAPQVRLGKGALEALGHSLLQFPGVARVDVHFAGRKAGRFPPSPEGNETLSVLPPEDPLLLGAVGFWESEQRGAEEVALHFDRPVRVEQLKVEDAETGEVLTGEYFQSIFNMAVIIHPEKPGSIQEGMPLKIYWQVSDGKDRMGTGSEIITLGRGERP
ncbi:GerMN domain-containing protein [Desulfuromonas sp.]|uniref:GerMN domain-containing protein n=1 Tax=Desulfuromonas sp. TaxID=892 RepID=UPI0025B7FC27|nr:GerMN domain-containing protein [Desulfuromonas sp.]